MEHETRKGISSPPAAIVLSYAARSQHSQLATEQEPTFPVDKDKIYEENIKAAVALINSELNLQANPSNALINNNNNNNNINNYATPYPHNTTIIAPVVVTTSSDIPSNTTITIPITIDATSTDTIIEEATPSGLRDVVGALQERARVYAGIPGYNPVPFSKHDYTTWLGAGKEAIQHSFSSRKDNYENPDNSRPPYPLKFPEQSNTMRIAIVGDMGTNDEVHKNVLKGIKNLDTPVQHIIHLGDIYASGTNKQCKAFWKEYAEVFPDNSKPLWSVPGNHEYISAGEGFFGKLMPHLGDNHTGDPKVDYPQKRSTFCLRNDDAKIQLIGLDTGYQSTNFTLPPGDEKMDYSSLCPEEAEWVQRQLTYAKSNGYRTIILMHHQLFSAFWKKSNVSATLLEQIKPWDSIVGWMWGHEHRLVVFHDLVYIHVKGINVPIRNAHCIGHGSIPEYKGAYNSPNLFQGKDGYIPDTVPMEDYFGKYKVHNSGFTILEINKPSHPGPGQFGKLTMHYYQVHRLTGVVTSLGPSRELQMTGDIL